MKNDKIQAFLFKNRPVRGALVRLAESYQTITLQHHYPAVLAKLLGEALLGVTLIASHFKQRGQTTLQFQGEGALNLLSVRITPEHAIRGLIRADAHLISEKNLTQALHHGQLSLSHESTQGQNYQSFIPIEAPSIAQALEDYFMRSEQLSTRFFLASTDKMAAGLILQLMPAKDPIVAQQDFKHLSILAETLKPEELLQLDFQSLLHRLYHEEELLLFEETPIHFGCNCSLEKMQRVVLQLGREEAEAILAEKAMIEVTCEFCNEIHTFDEAEVRQLFDSA